MKTVKLVLIILAVFTAARGFTSKFPRLDITPLNDKKARLTFHSATPTRLEISLTACDKEIVFFKGTEKQYNKFDDLLDLTHFDDGLYNLCLKYGNESINCMLKVDEKKISIGPKQRLYEPYLSCEGNKLKISFLNLAMKNVNLTIYKDGEYFTNYILGKGMNIQKCFDLSNIKKGKYEVVLSEHFKDHRFIVQI